MESVECLVVGAGVVGLTVARALAQAGHETLIVDACDAPASETSSRNSEVIHAGIYYPRGSLKAVLCVRGRELLYDYCRERDIEHRRCGKLIVATSDAQRVALDGIAQAARLNGVDDLRWLTAEEALQLEPALRCVAALISPSTGIIDSHSYMLSLLGDAEQSGAVLALRSAIDRLRVRSQGTEVCIDGEAYASLRVRWIINCAGLHAPALAARMDGFPKQHVPQPYYAKGSYFSLSGRAPFTRLVYPVPEPGGLGIHLTLDLAGQARFGPDVEWVDRLDYTVDVHRADSFYELIRRYWPGLRDGQLVAGYAGIRPKITAPGAPAADFRIDGPATHGVPGVVHLFGIESPGLTASLAIAERVAAIVASAGQSCSTASTT